MVTKRLLGCLLVALILALGELPALAQKAEVWLRWAGGSTGSAKNYKNELQAEVVRTANPTWTIEVITGPNIIAEIGMMQRGELNVRQIEGVQSLTDLRKGIFADRPLKKPLNMSWLYPVFLSVFYMVVPEDLPFNSFAELKEKKYRLRTSIDRPGSGKDIRLQWVLKEYGISYDDIKKWGGKLVYDSPVRTAPMIADGLLDAVYTTSSVPYAQITELSRKRKLKVIAPTEPEIRDSLVKKYNLFKTTIPAGTYNFTPKDVPTVAYHALLGCRSDMDEKIAYKIVKATWENRKWLHPLHPAFKEQLQADNIRESIKAYGEFLHPGAKKYWTEQGLAK